MTPNSETTDPTVPDPSSANVYPEPPNHSNPQEEPVEPPPIEVKNPLLDCEEALKSAQKALKTAQEMHKIYEQYTAIGYYQEALKTAQKAQEIYEKYGDWRNSARILEKITDILLEAASILADQGDYYSDEHPGKPRVK